ncbi:MAG: hypothetical protein WC752_00145 [Patescibacteria group bacterium]|jgi:hypothetical protein
MVRIVVPNWVTVSNNFCVRSGYRVGDDYKKVCTHLREHFTVVAECPDPECGVIWPAIGTIIEVHEPMQHGHYTLAPGVYKIVHHIGGGTSHNLYLKNSSGETKRLEAGWAEDRMVDWRCVTEVAPPPEDEP